jgi:WD40 repeat protein
VVVVGALVFAARDDEDETPPATITPTTSTTTTTTLPPPAELALSGHSGLVQAIDVSPDGRLVVSAGEPFDGTIRLWHATTGEQLWQVPQASAASAPVADIAFSPDGTTVAVRYGDDTTEYLDAADGGEGDVFLPPWSGESLATTATKEVASPDAEVYVALERFTGARLVDSATDQTIRRLASSGTAYTAAFSEDGRFVAVKFDDIVRVWRLDPFEQVVSFDLPAYDATAERLEFTTDGTRIVYTVEDKVFIMRVEPST